MTVSGKSAADLCGTTFLLGLVLSSSAMARPGEDPAPWKAGFVATMEKYRAAAEPPPDAIRRLRGFMDASIHRARSSYDYCRDACVFYEKHDEFLASDEQLAPKLQAIRDVYFEWALLTSTGPHLLDELLDWCRRRKLAAQWNQVVAIRNRIHEAKGPKELKKRLRSRRERAQAWRAVDEFRGARELRTGGRIDELQEWMRENQFAPKKVRERFHDLIGKIFYDSPIRASKFTTKLRGIQNRRRSGEEEAALVEAFETRVNALVRGLATTLLGAVDTCLKVDEPGLAFDLFHYLLRVDPGNRAAHKGLRHREIDGRWYRPYEARRLGKGLAWHDELGWIRHKQKERYETGEYFDLQVKKWAPLAKWNGLHANPETPWRLESEHFELFSTAELNVTADVLRRLEAFFLQAFRQYDLFFLGLGRKKRTELIFGTSSLNKKLNVYFYRDQEQYKKHASPGPDWAGGHYSPGAGASFFYAREGAVPVSTLQHELTHQILGEFSEGGRPPAWLVEGAAVFLEDAFFRDDTMEVGNLHRNGRLKVYRENLRAGKEELSFKDTLRLVSGTAWSQAQGEAVSKNYRGAGAVVYFLMKLDRGRYRGDVCDMLRDAYQKKRASPPSHYLGLSEDSLDFLMERFYRQCRHESYLRVAKPESRRKGGVSKKLRS